VVKPTKNPCVKRVFTEHALRGHPCGNPGKVEFEGQWYCGVHDPIKRKAKHADDAKKGKAEWERKKQLQKAHDESSAIRGRILKWTHANNHCRPDFEKLDELNERIEALRQQGIDA
jgi:hypothetical protein